MVCDFFYPQLGGVEFHIYHLAQSLIKRGHSVIVVTHAYGGRTGVRYLTQGLKVYYVPFLVLYRETSFPTVFASFPIIRNILLREQIEIVHSHGSVATLSHESLLHANTMGIKTLFTEHSLYGFDSMGSILVNKLLTFSLTNVDRVICVSNTCKENIVMRADLQPNQISVIPNAVVSEDFTPASKGLKPPNIVIVVIGRLFPNKGSDLLLRLIPQICRDHANVDFVIAGDGPKFVAFQQMLESHRLQNRVDLLGAVPHERVRDVMCRGNIYLHASLTEAFGTVLVEAASCGLLIVTTRVGGIPEVLPEHMTVYASQTSVSSLRQAAESAIQLVRQGRVNTAKFHEEIKSMYTWKDVALRTERVYHDIFSKAKPEDKDWLHMATRFHHRRGPWARKLYLLCCIVEYLLYYVLEFLYPRNKIALAVKWPKRRKFLESIELKAEKNEMNDTTCQSSDVNS